MFLLELFVVGTFWFYALIVLSSVAIIAFLENEKAWGATVTLIGTIAAMIFLGNTGFFPWLVSHPWHIVGGLLLYFVIGTLWGIIKWYLFVTNIKERYLEKKADFINRAAQKIKDGNFKGSDFPTMEEAHLDDWKETIKTGKFVGQALVNWRACVKQYEKDYYNKNRRITKPLALDNKSRILSWMTYWPWSALWTLLNDPVRRLMRRIYYRIKGILQGISDKIFKDIDAELEE
jgi:hypothetical protein